MKYSIFYDNTEIAFTVERRNRKTTAIQIHPDQSVRVLAPKFTTKRAIIRSVSDRASWILKKQREFEGQSGKFKKHDFLSGECFKFLGRDYILDIKIGKNEVQLTGDKLVLQVPEDCPAEKRKKILQQWYRKQSKQVFTERFKECMQTAAAAGIRNEPSWNSRILRRSWGSCTAEGNINLNLELVSAPVECIDYVILHELCHLRQPNHSKHFYSLLAELCPYWKQRKKQLDENYRSIFV